MKNSGRKQIILFSTALVLAISTLTGAVATVYARDTYIKQTKIQNEDLAKQESVLVKLKLTQAQASAEANAKKIATSIEKQQKEENARKKALEAAKRANVPTVSSNDNCSKPHDHSDPNHIDVVVNKKHCIQPLNFAPTTASISCAGGGSAVIATTAVNDFKALCSAAKAAGVPLGITSSYRSYETQIATYNYWVAQGGQAAADRYSARPGYSEHQTGLSVDFSAGSSGLDNFTGTPQQKWMVKNAYKYGWIQRYTTANSTTTGYNAETWHYRYIGRSAAAGYVSSGASSLEAFWNVSGGDY